MTSSQISSESYTKFLHENYPNISFPFKKQEIVKITLELPVQIEIEPEEDPELGSSQSLYIVQITPQNAKQYVKKISEDKYNNISKINSLLAIQEEIYIIDKILTNLEKSEMTSEFLTKKYDALVRKFEEIETSTKENRKTPKEYLEDLNKELIDEDQTGKLLQKGKRTKGFSFYQSRILKRIKVINEEIKNVNKFLTEIDKKKKEAKSKNEYQVQGCKFNYMKELIHQYMTINNYIKNNKIPFSGYYQDMEKKIHKGMTAFIEGDPEERDAFKLSVLPKVISKNPFEEYNVKNKNSYAVLVKILETQSIKNNAKSKELLRVGNGIYSSPFNWTPYPEYKVISKKEEIVMLDNSIPENTLKVNINQIFFENKGDEAKKDTKGDYYVHFELGDFINDTASKSPEQKTFNYSNNFTLPESTFNTLYNEALKVDLHPVSNCCFGGNSYDGIVSLKEFKSKNEINKKGNLFIFGTKTQSNISIDVALSIRTTLEKQFEDVENVELTKCYEMLNKGGLPKVNSILDNQGESESRTDSEDDKTGEVKTNDVKLNFKDEYEGFDEIKNGNYIEEGRYKLSLLDEEEDEELISEIEEKIETINNEGMDNEGYQKDYYQNIQKRFKKYTEIKNFYTKNKAQSKVELVDNYIKALKREHK